MTFHVSEIIRKYLAWCPNSVARPVRAAPPAIATPPVATGPAQPDGGAGGSGRIDRGIRLTTGSILFLFRNKRLLWFSLLLGLVMIFNLVSSTCLQIISGSSLFPGAGFVTSPAPVMIEQGSVTWIALALIVSFVNALLTYYLLAALIASVSLLLSGHDATLRSGLARVAGCVRPLVSWAAIAAVVGTGFLILMESAKTTSGTIENSGILYGALAFGACFYALTLFVVPALVLAGKNLIGAIRESVSLFRNLWGEVIVCFIIYFLIVFAAMVITMIPVIAIGFSAGSTAALGAVFALYLLVMFVLIFIGTTVMGITITGLYTYGKTGIFPALSEGKRMDTKDA
ncbi:DUF6159 family protein [Methanoregula sp.]|uniref:DUF6159 family protein n=1 Tax=Methanoregula sp. TaxID=2052170 RepID=UPI003563B97C